MDTQMLLYTIFRVTHNILRWVVILTALFAIIRAITGLSFRRTFMKEDDRAGLWFTISLDLQLLIGIVLYFFLSPTTTLALKNFSTAMSDPGQRFFAVEHVSIMLLAVIAAHVGRALSRKAPTHPQKHRRALIWYTITLVLVLAAIPWFRSLLPF